MKLKNETDVLVSKGRKFFFFHFTDFGSIYIDITVIRFIERTHNLQQGSFTSSTRPDNADNLPFIYFQINTFQDLQ